MECSCGGVTIDRKIVRKKEPVGEYSYCKACGRIAWLWLDPEWEEAVKAGKMNKQMTLV